MENIAKILSIKRRPVTTTPVLQKKQGVVEDGGGLVKKMAKEMNKESLNTKVADALGMDGALSFARGSASLYALFAALAKRYGPGEVIIPALCCEAVALAALYAGL